MSENAAESQPRVSAEVRKHRTFKDGSNYGYELSFTRAHNTFTYTELTLADLYRIRGAVEVGIQKIMKGEL